MSNRFWMLATSALMLIAIGTTFIRGSSRMVNDMASSQRSQVLRQVEGAAPQRAPDSTVVTAGF